MDARAAGEAIPSARPLRPAYRVAAEAVLLSHFVFAAAAVAGGFLLLAGWEWALVHLPIAVWSSAINFAGWTCPLTPLEKRLRVAAGGEAYEGGFIHHYFGPLVYPRGMPRRLELTAGVSVLVWNALVYGGVWLWLSRGS